MEERQKKDIENMLDEIKERYPTKFRPALQAINKCLSNIVQHPDDEFYKKIKIIDKNILEIPGILDIFDMIGFTIKKSGAQKVLIYEDKDEDDEESIDLLKNCISLFNKYLSKEPQSLQPKSIETIQIQRIQNPIIKAGEPRFRPKPIIYKIPQKNNDIDNELTFNRIKERNKNLDNKDNNNANIYNNDNDDVIFNDNEVDSNEVIYFIYDLSGGIVKGLSRMVLGHEIEGIYHTSVYVYGKEYYYQSGIQISLPRTTSYGKPIKEIHFGYTDKSQRQFKKYLRRIFPYFSPENYNTISNNCNHFTDVALFYLTGNHLPDNILKQHEEILKTPIGKQIKPYLEKSSNNRGQIIESNPLLLLLGNAINNAMTNKRKYNNKQKKSYYYNDEDD